jgi:nitrile hydratase accessory protein
MSARPTTLAVDGPAAPPRANGELVFAAPWESRVFGVTLSLYEAGHFEWSAFQAELIESIKAWEASHEPGASFEYYHCWLDALERLLDRLGVVEGAQLRARVAQYMSRPVGHDHGHDHDHE